MSRRAALSIAVALALAGGAALGRATAPRADQLTFSLLGFSIAAPVPPPGPLPEDAITLKLPPEDGFAPNVNVQLRPYAGSLEDYVALSLKEFADLKLTVAKPPVRKAGTVTLDYTGDVGGGAMHFYARAFLVGSNVYLATGTATAAQWPTAGPRLMASIDSFSPTRK